MQIKSHPDLGPIVQLIEEDSYPVDDVCHMRVPDHVRQQLVQLSKPSHVASTSNSSSTRGSPRPRISCRHGRECYRHDPDHREEFSHPGDSDYHSSNHLEKQKCRYGEDCFRIDIAHRQKYAHPNKQKCRYGEDCFRTDIAHRQKYAHPNDHHFHKSSPINFTHSEKQKCRYGDNCTKRNDREHMNEYLHD